MCCFYIPSKVTFVFVFLVITGAFRWVHVTKYIQFIQRGQCDEAQIPNHQYDAESFVQFPAVQMCGHNEKDDRREER